MPSSERQRAAGIGSAALLAMLLLLTGAAAPAAAQTAEGDSLCTWDACGLRQLGDGIFQGSEGKKMGDVGELYADLAVLRTGPPEAARLAEAALREHRIAAYAWMVAFPTYVVTLTSLSRQSMWRSEGSGIDGVTIGVAATSFVAMAVSNDARRRVRRHLSEAVWHYNAAVAAGDLQTPGKLPPLDPPHHGRFGIFAGAAAGLFTGGVAYARTEEVLPAVATFAATTFVGYLFGGSASRER